MGCPLGGGSRWATRYKKSGCCWARLQPREHPGRSTPGPRSLGTQRQSRRLTLDLQSVVPRSPSSLSLRDLVRARASQEAWGVLASECQPHSRCPGALRSGASPREPSGARGCCSLLEPAARTARRQPARPHSGAARASLASAVRAARSRAERGGEGPRPGPGFPRTRPRGERPRAPPWAAGRPGERLVPGPPPTLPDGARPHHPAIPPWQSRRPSPGPLAKAPRSHSLARAQEGAGYSYAGSPCSWERGNFAHLQGLRSSRTGTASPPADLLWVSDPVLLSDLTKVTLIGVSSETQHYPFISRVLVEHYSWARDNTSLRVATHSCDL